MSSLKDIATRIEALGFCPHRNHGSAGAWLQVVHPEESPTLIPLVYIMKCAGFAGSDQVADAEDKWNVSASFPSGSMAMEIGLPPEAAADRAVEFLQTPIALVEKAWQGFVSGRQSDTEFIIYPDCLKLNPRTRAL